ncbi:hypothetical protein [uncultured Campylobacter sp.]|uniref:hypothetical protein n=1 Tax=uncultured Campylobacter sp. TaxID=218934 RepID=UPI00260258AA|nr:hypothetical protein [uncultured Campylobacter sp.]
MNGQYAIKGYLFQSLVAILDSFKADWETVCVEPNDESEKVDILWTYKEGNKKVVQVKSSQNPFSFSSANKWANELTAKSPDADKYELILVGHIDSKLQKLKDGIIDKVVVINKVLEINDFEAIILAKINSFFEKKGKNIISPKLGKLFVRALNTQVLQDSVIGKTIKRSEFENNLLDSLRAIERHLEKSLYSVLLPDALDNKEYGDSAIIEHILNLIGWKSLSINESVTYYDEKLGKDQQFKIDFWGNYNSPLKDDLNDIVYINANIDAQYLSDYSNIIKYNTHCVNTVRKSLIENNKIKPNNSIEYCVQFLLSLKESEQNQTIARLNNAYKRGYLGDNIIYYAIDNKKADFLISSIITARKYRDGLTTKFLYPITDDNSQINKIGKRNTYMPPQYINSSILPIIKEDNNKISVLLFCSDPYSKDRLKKVIWLLIRLTSGLANEYKIYFTDYDNIQYNNEASEVIRSYNNNDLTNRIYIEKLNLCNCSDLQIVPLNMNTNIKDEDFDEITNKKKQLRIEPHLIDYLPYGDSLKPFLNSDAVKAEDLKIFLQNKGIYFRTASKTRIIQLMTSMLFSSLDIESLVEFVNVDKKTQESSSAQYNLVDASKKLSQLLANKNINQDELQNGLKADIVSLEYIEPKNDSDGHIFKMHLEQKNPNKQALVSIARSIAIVTIKKNDNKIEFTKEYNSKIARVAAERVVKQFSEQLIKANEIEERCIEIKFSEFTNKERTNFLLSFTNIDSSNIFRKFEAKSFKYMFDESANLPDEYADKKGKECIAQLKGRYLDSIKELQDDALKEIILSEELAINYKYNIRGVSGNYFVIMNFSGALVNKPLRDGIFNIKSTLYIDNKSKDKVSNINELESELKIEFNKLKKEKFEQFGRI